MTGLRFDDEVVIVTGAGRGLGREHALAFARRGAAVLVNDIVGHDGFNPADEVAAEIERLGGRAVTDAHSVSTSEGAQAIVDAALRSFGKVDILVNNAGIIDFAAFETITDDQWRRMIDVTLDGAFLMSRAVWPLFLAQGQGRIVNTTSNAGFGGNEMIVHYGAAKLGVAGLTRGLAQEAKGNDIFVNAIAPMAVTRMNRDAFFGGAASESDDWQADIRNGTVPMGPPEAVSATVVWLAHRDTRINGEIYSTSSGKVARVATVIGQGYFNPDHTPEDLAANAERIRAIIDPFEPTCCADELALIPPLFSKGNG
jgi:NAD(P)-dependent dehydrogenase (short-subunit alcohol dehydrogenase family)